LNIKPLLQQAQEGSFVQLTDILQSYVNKAENVPLFSNDDIRPELLEFF